MFFVWEFSSALGDFEPVGAFSVRSEADAMADEKKVADKNWPGAVIEQSFTSVINQACRVLLGKIADAIALTGAAPWPAKIWVVWKSDDWSPDAIRGEIVSLHRSEDGAMAAVGKGAGQYYARDFDLSLGSLSEGSAILMNEKAFPVAVVEKASA